MAARAWGGHILPQLGPDVGVRGGFGPSGMAARGERRPFPAPGEAALEPVNRGSGG
jgi:hypothetical protein